MRRHWIEHASNRKGWNGKALTFGMKESSRYAKNPTSRTSYSILLCLLLVQSLTTARRRKIDYSHGIYEKATSCRTSSNPLIFYTPLRTESILEGFVTFKTIWHFVRCLQKLKLFFQFEGALYCMIQLHMILEYLYVRMYIVCSKFKTDFSVSGTSICTSWQCQTSPLINCHIVGERAY